MSAITGPADVRDQKWLDEQVASIEDGVTSVINIYSNWTDGRNLLRLHPGMSAFDYIKANVPSFALGRKNVPDLLDGTNLSFNAIAQLTGVAQSTVSVVAATTPGLSKSITPRQATTGQPALGGRPVRNVTPKGAAIKPRPATAPYTDARITEFLTFLRTVEAPRHAPRLKVVDERLHEFFDKNHIACSHKP